MDAIERQQPTLPPAAVDPSLSLALIAEQSSVVPQSPPGTLPALPQWHQKSQDNDKAGAQNFMPAYIVFESDKGLQGVGDPSLGGSTWLRFNFPGYSLFPTFGLQVRQNHYKNNEQREFQAEFKRKKAEGLNPPTKSKYGWKLDEYSENYLQEQFEWSCDDFTFVQPFATIPANSRADDAYTKMGVSPPKGQYLKAVVRLRKSYSHRLWQPAGLLSGEQTQFSQLLGGDLTITLYVDNSKDNQKRAYRLWGQRIRPALLCGKTPGRERSDWFLSRNPLYDEEGTLKFAKLIDSADAELETPPWLKDSEDERHPVKFVHDLQSLPITHYTSGPFYEQMQLTALFAERAFQKEQHDAVYNEKMKYPARFVSINKHTFRVGVKLQHRLLKPGQDKVLPHAGTPVSIYVPDLFPRTFNVNKPEQGLNGVVCESTIERADFTAEVTIPETISDKQMECISEDRILHVFVFCNGADFLTQKRMKAIQTAAANMGPDPTPYFRLRHVVMNDDDATTSRDLNAALDDKDETLSDGERTNARATIQKLFNSDLPYTLNPEQQAFCNAVVQGGLKANVAILEGLPGTGKTATLAHVACAMMLLGQRVLITSQPNAAIDQLFSDILELIDAEPGLEKLKDRLVRCHTRQDENLLAKSSLIKSGPQSGVQHQSNNSKLRHVEYSMASSILRYCQSEKHAKEREVNAYLDGINAKAAKKKPGKDFYNAEHKLRQKVYDGSALVAATTFVASEINSETCAFDTIILDEAGMATEADLAMVANHQLRCNLFILTGDIEQLEPVVKSYTSFENPLGGVLTTSPLQRLMHGWPQLHKTTLQKNYRGHPSTFAMSNHIFYDDRMCAGLPEAYWNQQPIRQQIRTAIMDPLICRGLVTPGPATLVNNRQLFIDVNHKADHEKDGGLSWYNVGGIVAILNLVKILLGAGVPANSIGVITMYKADRVELDKQLALNNLPPIDLLSDEPAASMTAQTVDSFQGGEKDIIILHFVATHWYDADDGKGHPFGSIAHSKRLNVATTRAKHYQFFVGNRTYWEKWRKEKKDDDKIDRSTEHMVKLMRWVFEKGQILNWDDVKDDMPVAWKEG